MLILTGDGHTIPGTVVASSYCGVVYSSGRKESAEARRPSLVGLPS